MPTQLRVKPSSIPRAGLGVFAKQFIPRGVRVGPYEGERVEKDDIGDLANTTYAWEVAPHNANANQELCDDVVLHTDQPGWGEAILY